MKAYYSGGEKNLKDEKATVVAFDEHGTVTADCW